MNRREFLGVGAALALPAVAVAKAAAVTPLDTFQVRLDTMLLRTRKGDERQDALIDLTQNHQAVYRAIYAATWWPDGNSQGVFEEALVRHGRLPLQQIRFSGEGYDAPEQRRELDWALPGEGWRYVLRMNRYWVQIVDSKRGADFVAIGSSLADITGVNGRTHLKDNRVQIHGLPVTRHGYDLSRYDLRSDGCLHPRLTKSHGLTELVVDGRVYHGDEISVITYFLPGREVV